MRKFSIWHWAIFAILVVIGGLLFGGFIKAWYCHGLGSGEAASWMQAIGAAAAIVGAFWVSNVQQRAVNKERSDQRLLSRTVAAQSLSTLGYWAHSMMQRARDHFETDGAHGTSTFSPERLDHVRSLMEKFVDSSDSLISTVALIFIHHLWETKQAFVAVGSEDLRDHFIGLMSTHIDEVYRQLERLTHHKITLEAACYTRGIVME